MSDTVKTDCFGFHHRSCRIMTEMICKNRSCSFYKTKEAFLSDKEKYRKIEEERSNKESQLPCTSKKVRCVDTGKEYNSCLEAARDYKITSECISTVCHGRRETAAGMRWEFVE